MFSTRLLHTYSPTLFHTARRLYSTLNQARAPYEFPENKRDGVRLVCISDTHNSQDMIPTLPDGDILVHAGDMTESGTFEEADAALAWISAQKHPHKLVIAGNHDAVFTDLERRAELLQKYPNITFLQDETVDLTIRGVKLRVYGNAQTSLRGSPAFAYPRVQASDAEEGAARFWAKVPEDVDVLITHGPPAFHLDEVTEGYCQGCPALLHLLWRVRPRVHVFGHIHSGRGTERLRWTPAQAAYERICSGMGGWRELLTLARETVETLVWGAGEASTQATLLANVASHLQRDDGVLRAAVIIDI